jgi:hypothetical protein
MSLVPTARTCLVSFTDSEGIRHAVEVAAGSLYEAAAFAIGEFRRCGFTVNSPGPAMRFTVTVKTPATSHEVHHSKIEAWLESGEVRTSKRWRRGSGNWSAAAESGRVWIVAERFYVWAMSMC